MYCKYEGKKFFDDMSSLTPSAAIHRGSKQLSSLAMEYFIGDFSSNFSAATTKHFLASKRNPNICFSKAFL